VKTSSTNRYFWFRRFILLWTREHGPDAGLEQQAFQMLETCELEIDWEFLKQVETAAQNS
jgi:hypothetical protein